MKRLINKLAEKLFLRLVRSSVVTEYGGIKIASLRGDGAAFSREILGALELLSDHDPSRFRVVQRTTEFIVERTLPCGRNSGEYFHGTRTISIDYEPLDPEWDDSFRHGFFARLVIHEATHGRIRDLGIATTKENRIQVERICVAEENRFCKRIGHLREDLTEQLSQSFDPSRWDRIWSAGPLSQLWMGFARLRKKSKSEQGTSPNRA
jgi:hypothetical protein